MEYSRLKMLMSERKCTLNRLCSEVGITRSGLLKGWRNDSISFRHVLKVSVVLGVENLCEFYDQCQKEGIVYSADQKNVFDELERKYQHERIRNEELRGQVANLTDIIKSTLISLSKKNEE